MILDQYILSLLGSATPVNITDCSFSINFIISGSSVTYNASDFILGISDFKKKQI
jgi:hypothetical protein